MSETTIGGMPLSSFGAKLLQGYSPGACRAETVLLETGGRSGLTLLSQAFSPRKLQLSLDFRGNTREIVSQNFSAFCKAASGTAEWQFPDDTCLFIAAVTDFGSPVWLSDTMLTADLTLSGMRTGSLRTIAVTSGTISCASDFPKTDCRIAVLSSAVSSAESVTITLGNLSYSFSGSIGGTIVLDGIGKAITVGGVSTAADAVWTDLPYLVPGDNRLTVLKDGSSVTSGILATYRPVYF